MTRLDEAAFLVSQVTRDGLMTRDMNSCRHFVLVTLNGGKHEKILVISV